MNKAILLLHGFKRNGEDDFINLHDFFEKYENEYDVINEIYFDNYQLETLNDKYLNEEIDRVVDQLKNYKKIIIVGYSTGAIIASMIKSRLPKECESFIYAIVPPINIILAKWVPMGYRIWKKEKALKKKLGKERYESIKAASQANKNMEKYPVKISKYINTLRLKYRKELLNESQVTYLLSTTDTFVKTSSIIKKLRKRNREITLLPFQHDNVLKGEKKVFIDWFENMLENHN